MNPELKEVKPHQVYHLGNYEVAFPDGELTFAVLAGICTAEDCPCDNILMEWRAGDSIMRTWYTGDREWTDEKHKPLPSDVSSVFAVVETIPEFQRRYEHMVYLQRKRVLDRINRLQSPFQYKILPELLLPGADPSEGILGTVPVREQEVPFGLFFCGIEDCFCKDLSLVFPKHPELGQVRIESGGNWVALDGMKPSNMRKLRKHFKGDERLSRLLDFMFAERNMNNYHRYINTYERKYA